ncbi:hypothetical protein P879_01143 [Paragonimus westermani]|uniref:Tubulin polyglutamylase TTLL4 n=1 Tax=Paragonimus westermani TaxID=34504 RepID=A0A8T0DW15_9TREM|nr:hypothetical protein P879_01143 [Paragonimus westermani]
MSYRSNTKSDWLARKQFARQLNARLTNLALERQMFERSTNMTDVIGEQQEGNFVYIKGNSHSITCRKATPSFGRCQVTNSYSRNALGPKVPQNQKISKETIKSAGWERTSYDTKLSEGHPRNVLNERHITADKQFHEYTDTQCSFIIESTKNRSEFELIDDQSSTARELDEQQSVLVRNVGEPVVDCLEIPTNVDDNELDCLEDDKPATEEVGSTLDVSDSESTLGDQPTEDVGAIYPVIASLFPCTPSVIRFVGEGQAVSRLPKPFRSRLKWRPSSITPRVVKRLLKRCHFRLTLKSPDWLGYFGNHFKPVAFRPIREFQKVNHFPGSFQLGRKDKLWSNLCRLKTQFGHKTVDFVPRTFCLPCDARLLKEVWSRQEVSLLDCPTNVIGPPNHPRWIVKPPACARGIGVRVIRHWSDIPKQRHLIVQSYISRPYLINDTKFDLRLYVYVSGFNPFKAYLHRNGLVRFASLKYSTSVADISNRYVHLTNYSVNKHNNHTETGVTDHKWKLETLWRYLLNRGINVEGLWLQLKDIVFKTLVSVTNSISIMIDQHCRRRACVHELFGFDILLDENLKPWLLEVNVSPSLHTNTSLDNDVKSEVVTDMFNVAGFRLPPEYRSHNSQRTSFDELTPTTTSASTNEMISDMSINLLTTRAQMEDSTVASSIPQSRTRTPIRIPQYMNKKPKTPSHYSVESRGQSVTDQSVNFGINALFPVSDPRLWDVSLSWDERQKHIFHSKLVCREELSRNTTDITKGQVARLSRLARPTASSLCAIKSSVSNRARKRSDLTMTEELHNIVSHLTPDDVRTLVDLVDERYRAALGNFEPVFPVAGEHGLQLLLFLESCNGDNYPGHLGTRTPTFHYYDVLQYAFLTVYEHPNPQPPTFVKVTSMDTSTAVQLPDYQMLATGVLSSEALSNAAQITDICTEGITRLTELCRNGFHLSGTEAANQRTRWNQAIYAVGPRQHQSSIYSKPVAGECTVTKTRTAPQVNRAAGDVIESILDGEVFFRAQTGTPKKNYEQSRNRCFSTEPLQRNVSATAREDSNSGNQFNSATPFVSVRGKCELPVTVCTFRGSVPHSRKSFVKRANFGGQEQTSLAVPRSANGDSDSPTGLITPYWRPRIFSVPDGITPVPNSGPLNQADATGSSPCESEVLLSAQSILEVTKHFRNRGKTKANTASLVLTFMEIVESDYASKDTIILSFTLKSLTESTNGNVFQVMLTCYFV